MPSAGSITWFGHSTIQLTLRDERVVIIDPWFRDNPSCPATHKKPPRCDFLAITHGHSDHSGDAGMLIERFNPHVIATYELCNLIGMKHPKAKLEHMNMGGTVELDGVSFSLTRAYHSSSLESETGPMYAGMPCGVVIRADGLSTYYQAGDTDVFSDMKLIAEIFAPKVVALPIGDRFTMGPLGASLAARMLQPSNILPIHYGTFPMLTGTPEAFREALPADLKPRLVVPKVASPVEWTEQGLRTPA